MTPGNRIVSLGACALALGMLAVSVPRLDAQQAVDGAVSPGKFGIAVVSPPLDDAGNSIRAQRAIAAISNQLGGNPYVVAKR
jgi:Glutaminase